MDTEKQIPDYLQIKTTAIKKPPVILVYGPEGVGKSTFCKDLNNPIFIDTEGGLDMLGVQAFPRCITWDTLIDQLNFVIDNDLGYKSLVIDTLDWAEALAFERVCSSNGVSNISDIGFGKGYIQSLKLFSQLIKLLSVINEEKKMLVCITAHAQLKKFDDPERDSYDTYKLKLHEKTSDMFCEWVDVIGFVNHDVALVTSKSSGETKARSNGARSIYFEKRPAFVAKNRFKLPSKMAFEEGKIWSEMYKIIKESYGKKSEN